MTFKYSLLIYALIVTEVVSADPTAAPSAPTLNLYGTSKNLSKALVHMESQKTGLNSIREWHFFSGRVLKETELMTFCPTCTEVDPLPSPIPVNPCNKTTSITSPTSFTYKIKGDPSAVAQLAINAGKDQTVSINGKYIVQMLDVPNQSAIEKIKRDCNDCIEVDPLPVPTPVGGKPCM